jgi:predicted MPP superfamily phosphohydrolase
MDFLLGLSCLLQPSFLAIGAFYTFNTLVIPIVLGVVAAAGFTVWNRRPYEKRIVLLSLAYVAIAFSLVGARILMTHIEPYRLKLQTVTIQTDKVSRPIRILHISDIQSAAVGRYEKETFARMAELSPDLILFTGDLLQPVPPATFESELPGLAALLRTLHPSYGLWGVYGDVDDRLRQIPPTDLGGLTFLEDGAAVVAAGPDRLRLLGLSRSQSRTGRDFRDTVDRWLQESPGSFSLILGHAPDYALSLQDLPVDLCLAGHTHGGQIRLPWIGPLVIISRVPRAWARGFREIGKTRLNVSAGIGCEHTDGIPPIRFNCRPEMTLIELVPKPPAPPAPVPNKEKTR